MILYLQKDNADTWFASKKQTVQLSLDLTPTQQADVESAQLWEEDLQTENDVRTPAGILLAVGLSAMADF